ncbi:Wzz/FepE/Etk N-terminal domain-containing protein [Pseudorhodoplanes sp.]|jgi:Mrp family chromosome partitioning ATPase/capsular polysaccharide biosynthesis protein|uniref:Wzz/FepE/Etk N-terminal domain-containing protein n=1 Tax=Pseudorhodoplanes sp. TaxID=1934341 RepID=UPI002D7FA872|nr:Wzz/FepE/Etk N-terminal domain-containing protein [Pseudorhodoplanes sp.]
MHAPQPLDRLTEGIGERLGNDYVSNPRLHNEEVIVGALRLLWHRRWTFMLVAILAAALATLFLRFGPRTYTAEAVIRFDFAAGSSASTPRFSLDAAAVVDSEARIARSRIVAEHVVSRMKLFDDPAFSSPPGLLSRTLAFLDGHPAKTASQTVAAEEGQDDAFARAVTRLMGISVVDHDSKSYVIAIRARWSEPQMAARLANTLAQEYLRERHIQSLVATRARLSAELTQIGLRLGDKFPTYLAASTQLEEIGRTIEEANRPTTPIRSVALGDFTADIAIPAQGSPATVTPNPKSVYVLALIGALVLASAFMLLRQRYDTRLTNEWTVANRLGVRCFGILPDGANWRASARAVLYEAARSIALNAGLEIKEPGCRVVVLTSSLPDEGKTLLATTLAGVLAENGQRVLLIDATPQTQPHRLVRRSSSPPAADSKSDLKVGDDAPTATNGGKAQPFQLVVLRDRQRTLIGGEGFAEYMAAARKRHDIVIIKAPPVLMLSETMHLARYADLMMLLVHWRKTPARTAAQALRRLHEAGTPASGVVLANVRLRRHADAIVHDQSYYLARYGRFYASLSS